MIPICSVNGYSILTLDSDSSSRCLLSNTVYNLNTGEKFQTIQEAIDDIDTKDGHTIQVGTGVYYENVIINKTINLKGVNKQNTIIDGGGNGTVINITADRVNVKGFTIQNSGYQQSGMLVISHYNSINWNTIDNNWYGVLIWYSSHNSIAGNTFRKNEFGILVSSSLYNNLNWNIIDNNENGIDMWSSSYNTIKGNKITNNIETGMLIGHSSYNNIFWNNIENCNLSMYLWTHSDNNIIYQNNFFNNKLNADDKCTNFWDNGQKGNYWDDYQDKYPNADQIWVQGIWDMPYDIFGGNNQDRYPLCIPYIQSNIKMVFNHILIFLRLV